MLSSLSGHTWGFVLWWLLMRVGDPSAPRSLMDKHRNHSWSVVNRCHRQEINLCSFKPLRYWRCLICIECARAQSFQSCLTLCNPMGCSPPGSSVHEILQARILEWVAMPSSRRSSQPGEDLCLLHWQVGSLLLAAPGKPLELHNYYQMQQLCELNDQMLVTRENSFS